MIELEPPIQEVYQRALNDLPECNAEERAFGLSVEDVLRAHFFIANHFYLEGYGLGGIGPRDSKLLLSAVDRQFVSFGGKAKWSDRFDICATLFFGLIKNHAFHDANKRTAFLSVLFLLYKYKLYPSVSRREFEDFTVEIADNSLEKYDRFKDLRKQKNADPEVNFISWFLRKHTRQIDNCQYTITFRELKVILNRYGYDLKNPRGNYIDVVRSIKERKYIVIGPQIEREITVCQVGFPRWTAEVGKAALKTVRSETKLNPKNGVDSAAFFKGVDPLQTLITIYSEPLMSLANR